MSIELPVQEQVFASFIVRVSAGSGVTLAPNKEHDISPLPFVVHCVHWYSSLLVGCSVDVTLHCLYV